MLNKVERLGVRKVGILSDHDHGGSSTVFVTEIFFLSYGYKEIVEVLGVRRTM